MIGGEKTQCILGTPTWTSPDGTDVVIDSNRLTALSALNLLILSGYIDGYYWLGLPEMSNVSHANGYLNHSDVNKDNGSSSYNQEWIYQVQSITFVGVTHCDESFLTEKY